LKNSHIKGVSCIQDNRLPIAKTTISIGGFFFLKPIKLIFLLQIFAFALETCIYLIFFMGAVYESFYKLVYHKLILIYR